MTHKTFDAPPPPASRLTPAPPFACRHRNSAPAAAAAAAGRLFFPMPRHQTTRKPKEKKTKEWWRGRASSNLSPPSLALVYIVEQPKSDDKMRKAQSVYNYRRRRRGQTRVVKRLGSGRRVGPEQMVSSTAARVTRPMLSLSLCVYIGRLSMHSIYILAQQVMHIQCCVSSDSTLAIS